jgi:UDP-N-acetylmuramoyl-tripeptide--D-alanyl-D-alanine ligase
LEFESIPSKGNKILVFGDMAELGQESTRYHENMARIINSLPSVSTVILVGNHVKATANLIHGKDVYLFDNTEGARELFWNLVNKGDSVLLKASRVIQLESLLTAKDTEKANLVG